MNSKIPPAYNWIALFVMIAFAGVLIQGFIWYFVPINVVDFYNEPAKVLNKDKKVKRGEFLEFEIYYDKLKPYPAVISRSLVNDRVVTLSCETGALPVTKGIKKTQIRVFIPLNVWPGMYRLLTDMTYHVNPLQDAHETYETEWFEVTE